MSHICEFYLVTQSLFPLFLKRKRSIGISREVASFLLSPRRKRRRPKKRLNKTVLYLTHKSKLRELQESTFTMYLNGSEFSIMLIGFCFMVMKIYQTFHTHFGAEYFIKFLNNIIFTFQCCIKGPEILLSGRIFLSSRPENLNETWERFDQLIGLIFLILQEYRSSTIRYAKRNGQ